ncbi:LysM peptidoglycan-binding domain-containing protein [Desulfovermiculus halophilus]|uniref:LysM peptidoglycan-binding domain-containing protein n=1 Tax=Desulfovermiculus halophilus TaxID=339722 RepID=UPI000485D233|nr:LysM domain-containing protein [Desulfovermiculus halophilus]
MHTVRKGEYLYSILRSLQIPEDRLGTWARRVIALNPHLADPDVLQPGTRLYLPRSLKARTESGRDGHSPKSGTAPIRSVPYTVQTPRSASSLLQDRLPAQTPAAQKRYARLFRAMNPQADEGLLSPGQTVYLPRPLHQTKAPQSTGGPEQTAATRHPGSSPPDSPAPGISNRELVITRLSRMDFSISREGEVIYPYGRGQWVRVHLGSTPLVTAPWGASVLLDPGSGMDAAKARALSSAGLWVCPVPSDWSPANVFSALEQTCRSGFVAWSEKSPLIISLPQGPRIEIKAPTILGVHGRAKPRFTVYAPSPASLGHIPSLLLGYLQGQDITILPPEKAAGSPENALHIPPREHLLTPSLSRTELVSMHQSLGAGGEGTAPNRPRSAGETLVPKSLHLSWVSPDGLEIGLYLDGYRSPLAPDSLFFLPPKQSDPYLLALLNLMGYAAYRLDFSAVMRAGPPRGTPTAHSF